ncbi:hypothetical protein Tco_1229941 [Tanacetum coccineum]
MEPNKALGQGMKEADSVGCSFLKIILIGSLDRTITSSRPDITFTVCACARFQVTPKTSHLHAVKRIFRTDISKITRKPSKTGKHGHEERKSTKEAKDSKLKPRKVNLWSILGQQKSTHKRTKPQKLPL